MFETEGPSRGSLPDQTSSPPIITPSRNNSNLSTTTTSSFIPSDPLISSSHSVVSHFEIGDNRSHSEPRTTSTTTVVEITSPSRTDHHPRMGPESITQCDEVDSSPLNRDQDDVGSCKSLSLSRKSLTASSCDEATIMKACSIPSMIEIELEPNYRIPDPSSDGPSCSSSTCEDTNESSEKVNEEIPDSCDHPAPSHAVHNGETPSSNGLLPEKPLNITANNLKGPGELDPTLVRIQSRLRVFPGELIAFTGQSAEGMIALTNYRLVLIIMGSNLNQPKPKESGPDFAPETNGGHINGDTSCHDDPKMVSSEPLKEEDRICLPLGVIDYIEVRDLMNLHILTKYVKCFVCSFSSPDQTNLWFKQINDALIYQAKMDHLYCFKLMKASTNLSINQQTSLNPYLKNMLHKTSSLVVNGGGGGDSVSHSIPECNMKQSNGDIFDRKERQNPLSLLEEEVASITPKGVINGNHSDKENIQAREGPIHLDNQPSPTPHPDTTTNGVCDDEHHQPDLDDPISATEAESQSSDKKGGPVLSLNGASPSISILNGEETFKTCNGTTNGDVAKNSKLNGKPSHPLASSDDECGPSDSNSCDLTLKKSVIPPTLSTRSNGMSTPPKEMDEGDGKRKMAMGYLMSSLKMFPFGSQDISDPKKSSKQSTTGEQHSMSILAPSPTNLGDRESTRIKSTSFSSFSEFQPEILSNRNMLARLMLEFSRMSFDDGNWRLTEVNRSFASFTTYPEFLVVPKSVTDEVIMKVASFRSFRRIPTVCWRSQLNGCVICRSSQPEVGWFGWRSDEDENLMVEIVKSCFPSDAEAIETKKLLILDARSYAAAVANRAKGGGVECPEYYPSAEVQFMCLPNIHQIRKSFQSLRYLCQFPASDPNNWQIMIDNSKWLHHISGLIKSSLVAVNAIRVEERPVLVHCSDGWDRTPQVVGLAQLLLDPYYRTLDGFMLLIQKEWVEFGHKFADRCGTAPTNEDTNERCPIFLQWIDCIHQISKQFPSSFEFNTQLLIELVMHVHSSLFGTFTCNNMNDRSMYKMFENTFSLWSYLGVNRNEFINHFYTPSHEIILPSYALEDMVFWNDVYVKHSSSLIN